jgi:hypothetical protein
LGARGSLAEDDLLSIWRYGADEWSTTAADETSRQCGVPANGSSKTKNSAGPETNLSWDCAPYWPGFAAGGFNVRPPQSEHSKPTGIANRRRKRWSINTTHGRLYDGEFAVEKPAQARLHGRPPSPL